jgi:type VII secretion protein EccE
VRAVAIALVGKLWTTGRPPRTPPAPYDEAAREKTIRTTDPKGRGVVAAGLLGGRDLAEPTGGGASPKVRTRPVGRGRLFGVRAGQLVSTQVAAAGVLIGAVSGTIALAAAVALAIIVLALTWLRMRGRWAFEWLDIAIRFGGRRHTVAVDGTPTALLEFVAPGSRVDQADLGGAAAAVIVDGAGLTTVLELGDPTGLLAEEVHELPSPSELLPTPTGDHPPCRIQLLLSGVPAPAIRAGGGTPANSYRQLTDGRLLGHNRALLAVRVLRAEGWSEQDLRRALSGLVRKLPRRLGAVPARPLGEAAAVRVIAEMAHDDGAGSAQETWPGLRVGGLVQATFRLRRWPDPRIETSRRLISRMLALPAAATTVAVTAGPRSEARGGSAAVTVTVRLASPDAAALGVAGEALRKVLSAERASARRLDGEHRDGLAATLPLGGMDAREVPGRPVDQAPPADVVNGLDLAIGPAGLMIGNNRHGGPVVARFFRPEQTRAMLVGGVQCAQLLALRAMALGARVVVQTARPHVWEPFVRGAAVPGESIAVVPPGRTIEIAPGSALHPLFVVVDVGPVGADTRPGAGWQATLVVRDDFGAADVDVASRADLLLLQPLRPDEAALVGTALGLGDTAQWLTRIRPDMLGLVNRRAVRWAALAQTPIEAQLIGPAVRA